MNIAIDGPAGAGKSTIAKKVAEKLTFIYVDTGAMYRAMALYCLRAGIKKDEQKKIEDACKKMDVRIGYEHGEQQVYLNEENVSGLIRTEEVSQMTSAISVYGAVRAKLMQLQRKLAAEHNVVMDGRDIGTAVLPNAELKIYLTASVETRGNRRYLEQKKKGIDCNLQKIMDDIKERDERDMHREIAPLKQAVDAVYIDSSDMTIEEVAGLVVKLCKERKK